MNRTPHVVRLYLWLILCVSSITFAQPPSTSTFRTIPNPPLANQPFDAVFGVVMHYDATGFYGIYPQYRVLDDRIDILFDVSCFFICAGLGNPAYTEYPLVMPAVPAGSYTVRFAHGDFDNPSQVFGEFHMIVGDDAVAAQLPVGDSVPWLLGLFLIFATFARLRLTGAPLAKSTK